MQPISTSPAAASSVSQLTKSLSTSTTPPTIAASAQTARAADGDYKVRSAATSQTKDADGDYKPSASSAAATSSSAVLQALTSLKKGG